MKTKEQIVEAMTKAKDRIMEIQDLIDSAHNQFELDLHNASMIAMEERINSLGWVLSD